MSFAALVFRNLLYHWRGNLAVFLGVALGSAVLTGALLVGDSLRGSLRELTLSQLGWVDDVLAPGRFFDAKLADRQPVRRASVILLQGSATPDGGDKNKSSRMQLLGVDADFWSSADEQKKEDSFWSGGADEKAEVVLNTPLAKALEAKVGDTIWLNVQKSDNIPRETLLGKRKSDDVLESFAVVVRAILPDRGMARFALKPSPEPTATAFVPKGYLQKRFNLKNKVNAILMAKKRPDAVEHESRPVLVKQLTLADWGLKLLTPENRADNFVRFLDPRNEDGKLRRLKWQGRVPEILAKQADENGILTADQVRDYYARHRRYLVLQSEQMYLDAHVEKAAQKALDTLKVGARPRPRPTLIYLADRISSGGAEEPYATVAAVEFDRVPGTDNVLLGKGGIRLVTWPGSPLHPTIGAKVELAYYFPDERNQLKLRVDSFTYSGHVALDGEVDDPDWTPEFPGLTDKLDISGWENPPFPPYNTKKLMERIKPADEEFWKRYRATPKAYITLEAGQELWTTRFGKLTSLRLDLAKDQDANPTAAAFETALLGALDPERGGFIVQNVREQALKAASGSTDFGVLFLSFSFFLIVAALLLVGLLVRLNLERRAAEIGLLAATGWAPSQLSKLLTREGIVLVLLGSALGLVGARWFADGMLRLLAVKWPGQGTLQFLKLHATPMSFAIGFVASILVSLLTLRWALRGLGRLSPRQLLAGETAATNQRTGPAARSWWVMVVALVGAAGSLAAAFFVKGHEAQAGSFFGGGFLLLAAVLAATWRWLARSGGVGDPQPTLLRLGIRNAGRNPVRSVLTVGLLAAATFLIVAVQAFYHEPAEDFFHVNGGSGGSRLFVQTEVPLFENLGDPKVLSDLGVADEIVAKIESVDGLRVQPGDDASCLNLYAPLKPRILGVPRTLIQQGRFAFAGSLAKTDEEKANPWLLLEQPQDDGSVPAILDANSAQWILKVGLGETLEVKNQAGEPIKLRVVALLKESMFQSEVLIAESSFLKLYPNQQGFQFFLIRCIDADQDAVRKSLKTALAAQGGQVQPTFDRLANYLAVENTYLATFQALGGLGLLLGALGLAIVLVRGVWERRGELALLRALGFRASQLMMLVLAENLSLLVLGLAIGTAAALVSVAPHLVGGEAKVLWGQIALLLAFVSTIGMIAGIVAVLASLRTPVLTALRRE